MGRKRNMLMIQEAKEIWEFCLANQVTLTAEYLLGTLNTRLKTLPEKWKIRQGKLNKLIFQKLIHALGPVDVDLFASGLHHETTKCISWQPDPHLWMVDAFQIKWTHRKAYAFLAFAFIGRVLAKPMRDKRILIIITPVWRCQPCYTQLWGMSTQEPIFIAPFPIYRQTETKTNTHCVRIKH